MCAASEIVRGWPIAVLTEVLARAETIPGWYPRDQLRMLYQLGQGREAKLEVGTWKGRSAYVLAASGGRLWCVDAWVDSAAYPGGAAALAEARAALAEWPVVLCVGPSDVVLSQFRSESFDLVHLDGDHRPRQFTQDLLESVRVIKPGGVICGDDYDEVACELLREARGWGWQVRVYQRLWWIVRE